MSKPCVAFVLAAGQSARLGSGRPKTLHNLWGQPVLGYALQVACHWASSCVVVASSAVQQEMARNPVLQPPGVGVVLQQDPCGTGHAFSCGFYDFFGSQGKSSPSTHDILVLLGDASFMEPTALEDTMKVWQSGAMDMLVVAMRPPGDHTYGRLVFHEGHLWAIEEASQHEGVPSPQGALCNTGIFLMKESLARSCLPLLQPQGPKGEYRITDMVALAVEKGYKVSWVEVPWCSFGGINTKEDFCTISHVLQKRFRQRALHQGAFLLAPDTVFLSYDTVVAPDVILHPHVHLGPKVVLGRGTQVLPFCVLDHCQAEENCVIGPFAYMRGGCHLKQDVRVGCFVEMKNTFMDHDSKAKHLSYLGDATIGHNVNIGASVITANYDGHDKHPTIIEAGCSIGAHTTLVAPLKVEADATVAAGSTITRLVPAGTLAVARCHQKVLPLSPSSKHRNRPKKGV